MTETLDYDVGIDCSMTESERDGVITRIESIFTADFTPVPFNEALRQGILGDEKAVSDLNPNPGFCPVPAGFFKEEMRSFIFYFLPENGRSTEDESRVFFPYLSTQHFMKESSPPYKEYRHFCGVYWMHFDHFLTLNTISFIED